jgi:hypothetical protein
VGKILAVAGSLTLGVLAIGCSTSQTVVNHPSGSSSGVAHTGDTLTLQNPSGRHFDITLTQVVDPAQGVGKTKPKSGKRFVAAIFKLSNSQGAGFTVNSNLDADVVGSNGQVYLPNHASLTQCEKDAVQFQMASGQSPTTCVAFQLKSSISVSKVQFYPAAGSANDYGEWLVP